MAPRSTFAARMDRDGARWRRSLAALTAVAWSCLCAGNTDASDALTSREFAPRSGPRAATLFTTLPPETTGIRTENHFADPRMWGARYKEFAVGAMGTGVAIADTDHDGRPDVFIVSKTERSRLFRNLGAWKFEDVTEKAGLLAPDDGTSSNLGWARKLFSSDTDAGESVEIWKQGAVFADVDNDGWVDLYLCRLGAPNLLFINQRDGTFKEEAAARGLAVSDACGMAAFADYDRDGWLDVFIQTNLLDAVAHPNGQPDHLFHNDRDGTFTEVTTSAGIAGETQGHSATWWDYDNDGWPDLYLANDFATPDVLYHNRRDGTFVNVTDAVLPHTPFSGMGADLGDVNNDGLVDLFVADMAASTAPKDLRSMVDSRGGHADDHAHPEIAPQLERNALYLNTDTGVCREASILAGIDATDWTWSPRLEDLDNDGRLDLHVTNGMNREQHNIDLLSRMMGAESPAERLRLMRESPVLAETNLVFRNCGDLRFEETGAAWGLDHPGVSLGSAWGDLDGDGDLDLVFANYEAGATVVRNDSDTGHRVVFTLQGVASNRHGVGATLRVESAAGVQVRQLVLARGYLSSSEPVLHFGLGADERITRLTVSWPSGHTQVFTDLASDRSYTLREPDGPATIPTRDRVAKTGQFEEVSRATNLAVQVRESVVDETHGQLLLPVRHNRQGPSIAIGDLNGDDRDDVLFGGTTRDAMQLRLGESAPAFGSAEAPPPAALAMVNDGPTLIFDANSDGRNDLLVTHGGVAMPAGAAEYQPRLLLGDARGKFAPAGAGALPPLPVSIGALAAADFDRDGDLDVFLGGRVTPGEYPVAPRSALLGNRDGVFTDATDAIAPGLTNIGMVTSALWSDVDGDGWLDLLLALEWGGVRVWHNNQGRTFDDRSEVAGFASAGTGWWTSLDAGDFNGDGRMDYVAGNVGLNTQYRASTSHPTLLFHGEFEPGRPAQLVEARWDGDRLVPWRSRRQMGAAIRSVLKRFPKNDDYARATLGEIVGEDRLAAAQRYAATELRSGVFLSQADGRHQFEALPRVAQIAPLQGVATGDFDGDGHADIYAVQNSYAPVPAVGRFDGGLSQLLRGDGRGGFAPATPAESGLIVRGDAKSLAVLDLDRDGWADFVVTRNNATALAYRNHGVAGGHAVRVVLRGPTGNASAAGARITLEHASGAVQTAEIRAGGGWWTQSSAACFFGWRDADAPWKIRVRWPSGETTTHPFPAGESSIIVAAPSR